MDAVEYRIVRKKFVGHGYDKKNFATLSVMLEEAGPPGHATEDGVASGRAGVEFAVGRAIIENGQYRFFFVAG